jgi:aspergillopepsin I
MRQLAHGLAALLALIWLAVAVPTEKRSHFSLHQSDNIRAPRAPEVNYLQALQKFHLDAPDALVAAISSASRIGLQEGSAPAIPEPFDSEYLTSISIGGQNMNVAIDTGSADLWVFSSRLSAQDREGHRFYTPGPSARLQENLFWRVRYGDGTTASGVVYFDSVSVGGVTSPQQAVGAAHRVEDLFIRDKNNDGVMGISFTSLSISELNTSNLPPYFQSCRANMIIYAMQSNPRSKRAGSTTSRTR